MSESASTCSLAAHAWLATVRYVRLVGHEAGALLGGRYRRPWRRAGVDLLLLPGLGLLQLVNWCGLWLDELLFPGIRKVEIRRPVFVLGPPRGGTTHLHRVLAEDRARFSTAQTWEVFFAPSVLQKRLLRGLAALDRRIGRPLARLASACESRLLGGFDATHPSALSEPEEDYFYLSWIHGCSGMSLAFPEWPPLWRLMPGVADDPAERRRALDFHQRCLRRQLYADGGERFLLSKNASFASWLDLLPEVYPDARFVICSRSASEAVPSMLSVADRAMEDLAATPADSSACRARLVGAMEAHYRAASEALETLPPDRIAVFGIEELKFSLPKVLERLSEFLEVEFSEAFAERIDELGARSRRHRSRHRYAVEDYRLDPGELDRRCPRPAAPIRRTA